MTTGMNLWDADVWSFVLTLSLLFAAMIEAAGLVIAQGETAAQGIFGAMLLRRDAGGYVLLGTVSFAAAVEFSPKKRLLARLRFLFASCLYSAYCSCQ